MNSVGICQDETTEKPHVLVRGSLFVRVGFVLAGAIGRE